MCGIILLKIYFNLGSSCKNYTVKSVFCSQIEQYALQSVVENYETVYKYGKQQSMY
jgi:hypothetical protein